MKFSSLLVLAAIAGTSTAMESTCCYANKSKGCDATSAFPVQTGSFTMVKNIGIIPLVTCCASADGYVDNVGDNPTCAGSDITTTTTGSTTTSAVRASTCVESSGVCVCSGECPSFTASWGLQSVPTINGNKICAVNNLGLSNVISDVVTINGQTYTSMDNCSDAMAGGGGGNSAGMVGAYYARAFVAAAAVAGGVAYAI